MPSRNSPNSFVEPKRTFSRSHCGAQTPQCSFIRRGITLAGTLNCAIVFIPNKAYSSGYLSTFLPLSIRIFSIQDGPPSTVFLVLAFKSSSSSAHLFSKNLCANGLGLMKLRLASDKQLVSTSTCDTCIHHTLHTYMYYHTHSHTRVCHHVCVMTHCICTAPARCTYTYMHTLTSIIYIHTSCTHEHHTWHKYIHTYIHTYIHGYMHTCMYVSCVH